MSNIIFRNIIVITLFFLTPLLTSAQIEFEEHVIDDDVIGTRYVFVIDIDDDGDQDILVSVSGGNVNEINWWENDGDQDFTEHNIAEVFPGAREVYAVDVDNDDDIDVLGAAIGADAIRWWENDGDEDFTEHTITDDFLDARSISGVDIDNDDDIDILGASNEGVIIWWENDGEQEFTEHEIENNFERAWSVHPIDMDNDEDIDIVGAAQQDLVSWWENDGEQNFTEYLIDDTFDGPQPSFPTDLDGDNDVDIIVGGFNDLLSWYENDGEQEFTEHTIPANGSVKSVFPADLDNDGDIDIVGAQFSAREATWWENDGGQEFETHAIVDDFGRFYAVYVSDIDGDGDKDIVAASYDNGIIWFENELFPDFTVPDSFSLITPDDETVFGNFPLFLTWENTVDNTPGDSVRYTVYISPDSTFEDLLVTECINAVSDTSVEVIHLTDSTTYWWKVLAEDIYDNHRWSNETWSFTFNWEDPGDELAVKLSSTSGIPKEFGIVSTYPNPFNSTLTITIGLPEPSNLAVSVYNLTGQRVATLADGNYQPGYHLLTFNGSAYSSGIYLLHAKTPGNRDEMQKILLLK